MPITPSDYDYSQDKYTVKPDDKYEIGMDVAAHDDLVLKWDGEVPQFGKRLWCIRLFGIEIWIVRLK